MNSFYKHILELHQILDSNQDFSYVVIRFCRPQIYINFIKTMIDYQTHLSNLMIFATENLVQMIILMRLEGILILIQLMFMSTA